MVETRKGRATLTHRRPHFTVCAQPPPKPNSCLGPPRCCPEPGLQPPPGSTRRSHAGVRRRHQTWKRRYSGEAPPASHVSPTAPSGRERLLRRWPEQCPPGGKRGDGRGGGCGRPSGSSLAHGIRKSQDTASLQGLHGARGSCEPLHGGNHRLTPPRLAGELPHPLRSSLLKQSGDSPMCLTKTLRENKNSIIN